MMYFIKALARALNTLFLIVVAYLLIGSTTFGTEETQEDTRKFLNWLKNIPLHEWITNWIEKPTFLKIFYVFVVCLGFLGISIVMFYPWGAPKTKTFSSGQKIAQKSEFKLMGACPKAIGSRKITCKTNTKKPVSVSEKIN